MLVRNGRKRYLLEVDVEYPIEPYEGLMKSNKLEKPLPNLYNKEKYMVHIRALDQVLTHGLVLKKVHRVFSFQQSVWLKVYIHKNTELRKKETILRRISLSL